MRRLSCWEWVSVMNSPLSEVQSFFLMSIYVLSLKPQPLQLKQVWPQTRVQPRDGDTKRTVRRTTSEHEVDEKGISLREIKYNVFVRLSHTETTTASTSRRPETRTSAASTPGGHTGRTRDTKHNFTRLLFPGGLLKVNYSPFDFQRKTPTLLWWLE